MYNWLLTTTFVKKKKTGVDFLSRGLKSVFFSQPHWQSHFATLHQVKVLDKYLLRTCNSSCRWCHLLLFLTVSFASRKFLFCLLAHSSCYLGRFILILKNLCITLNPCNANEKVEKETHVGFLQLTQVSSHSNLADECENNTSSLK